MAAEAWWKSPSPKVACSALTGPGLQGLVDILPSIRFIIYRCGFVDTLIGIDRIFLGDSLAAPVG